MKATIKIICLVILLFGAGTMPAQNMGINSSGSTPDASAVLDLNTGNAGTRGFLPEQVALTATNAAAPITSPATGLFVYNTATAGSAPNNVTPGYYYNGGTPGAPNWIRFSTGGGSGWLLTGNAGTVDGTNFLGTTDNVPLSFYVNNTKSGRIETDGGVAGSNYNTFLGYKAALSNSGVSNTALGTASLFTNTSGSNNTSLGAYCMYTNNGNYNTAVGNNAMFYNSSGGSNVAIGYYASFYNTTGYQNVGIGPNTLLNNTNGNTNIAIGSAAMYNNTLGSSNIAIGVQALQGPSNVSGNIAIGNGALSFASNGLTNCIGIGYNTVGGSGTDNIGIGSQALAFAGTASHNLAIGTNAMYSANNAGSDNTAIGYYTLQTIVGGFSGNTALGSQILTGNNLQGNYNVFLGFQVGSGGGWWHTGSNNIAIGTQSAYNFRDEQDMLAIGFKSLYTSGLNNGATAMSVYNVAVGNYSLFSLSPTSAPNGIYNTAIGYGSLYGSTTASYMTALGYQSGYANTTGSNNSYMGYQASYNNTSGSNNTTAGYWAGYGAVGATYSRNCFYGDQAGQYANSGSQNTAMGMYAMQNVSSGGYNTAVGYNTLGNSNITGTQNTGVGYNAIAALTSGNYNVGIGPSALASTSSGTGNIGIGYNAVTGAGNNYGTAIGYNTSCTGTNSVALGNGATCAASNAIVLGNASVTSIGGYAAAYTNLSDARVKKNIQAETHGLDFILKLKPVTYNYNIAEINKRTGSKNADAESMQKAESIRHDGFLAQDVASVTESLQYEFSGLHKPENDTALYSLSYSDFVVPLVKATQELNAKNDSLQKICTALQDKLVKLQQELTSLQKNQEPQASCFVQTTGGAMSDTELKAYLIQQDTKIKGLESVVNQLLKTVGTPVVQVNH
jgi:hypothetical protein